VFQSSFDDTEEIKNESNHETEPKAKNKKQNEDKDYKDK